MCLTSPQRNVPAFQGEDMATIDEYRNRNGKMFRVRVRRSGQTFTRVFPTRAEAKNYAKVQEGLVLAGRATPSLKKPAYTLGEAFERYCQDILPRKKPSTRRPQRYQVTRLLTLLGANTRLVDITPARIRALITELEKTGVAPATIVRYLALLSHLFTVAILGMGEDQPRETRDETQGTEGT
jgi:hypothetical protein